VLMLKDSRLREVMREKKKDLDNSILAFLPESDTVPLSLSNLQYNSRAADLAGANPCNLLSAVLNHSITKNFSCQIYAEFAFHCIHIYIF
jgi:hypothetical protein